MLLRGIKPRSKQVLLRLGDQRRRNQGDVRGHWRSGFIKGRHAQNPPASSRAHQRGEQSLVANNARQVLYDIIKRVTLVVEQALAFLGIQPVGGVWLATEGTFRQHADAHHLQHASKVVPVQDLATGPPPLSAILTPLSSDPLAM